MLKIPLRKYYQVKEGQTLNDIARAFSVSEYLLAKSNGLRDQPYAGQILRIPSEQGNLYTVRAGDTKELLCGSAENYEKLNGTPVFYIGMRVRISL